jgi:hypothetical protein
VSGVELERLREQWRRTTITLSVPFDKPFSKEAVGEFLSGVKDYIELNRQLIIAQDAALAAANERVKELERFETEYDRVLDVLLKLVADDRPLTQAEKDYALKLEAAAHPTPDEAEGT